MERAPTFVEIDGYFGWCGAEKLADGEWCGTVWFERKADHGQVMVPARKHTISMPFANERDATQAAIQLAQDLVARGGTGF